MSETGERRCQSVRPYVCVHGDRCKYCRGMAWQGRAWRGERVCAGYWGRGDEGVSLLSGVLSCHLYQIS